MTRFTFGSYVESELESCGDAFASYLRDSLETIDADPRATTRWTESVLDWFGAAAAPGVTVYSLRQNGEFMLDLTHTSWSTEPWPVALEKPCRVRLALESEWGVAGDKRTSASMVLDDAAKIASVRADLKVMVFGSSKEESHRNEIVTALSRLRTQSGDSAPWLWVDVPWWRAPGGKWTPVFGVFRATR